MTLLLVGEAAVGVTVKQLRERLDVPGSSLTFTLDALESKRLIRRQRSKRDRRQWDLELTQRGRHVYSEMVERETKAIEPSLSNFSDAEREAFLTISEEIMRVGRTSGLRSGRRVS